MQKFRLFFSLAFTLIPFLSIAETPRPIVTLSSENYNRNAELCCFLDWGTSGWLTNSLKFPDQEVYSLDQGKKVRVSSLVKNRPIVIQIGSLTCPSYALNISRTKKIKEKYKGIVDFYTLYTRENHPGGDYGIHKDFSQKISYAKKLIKDEKINHGFLIDDIQGTLHQKLGNFGNSLYLIGTDMHVNHWSIFPDHEKLETGIKNLISANGKAEKADFIGGSFIHSLVSEKYSRNEKTAVGQKMKALEGSNPAPTAEQLLQMYERLRIEQPEIYNRISPHLIEKLKTLSVYRLKNDMNVLQNKLTWNSMFLTLHEDIKKEYEKRQMEWTKINNVKSDQKSLSQILSH